MPIFRDSDQFYACVGELMERAKVDPDVGKKIAKSKIVLQFRYTEPTAMTTVNAKTEPTQEGAYVDVIQGDIGDKIIYDLVRITDDLSTTPAGYEGICW